MSLKTKLKILVVMVFSAVLISILLYLNETKTILPSRHFFEGLLMGVVSTSLLVLLISIVLTYIRKRKTIDSVKIETYNRQLLLSAGMFSLIAGIFLLRLGWEVVSVTIVSIILFIISSICNITYLRKMKNYHTII